MHTIALLPFMVQLPVTTASLRLDLSLFIFNLSSYPGKFNGFSDSIYLLNSMNESLSQIRFILSFTFNLK